MPEASRKIFRDEALRHYMLRQDKPTYPKLVGPSAFVAQWVLLCVTLAAGALACLVRVPRYVSGVAVLAENDGGAAESGGACAAVLLAPAETRLLLTPGRKVLLDPNDPGGGADERSTGYLIGSVETEILSPREARRRFALGDDAAPEMGGPVAVACVRLEAPAALAPGGSVRGARVEVGACRVGSFLWGDCRPPSNR